MVKYLIVRFESYEGLSADDFCICSVITSQNCTVLITESEFVILVKDVFVYKYLLRILTPNKINSS